MPCKPCRVVLATIPYDYRAEPPVITGALSSPTVAQPPCKISGPSL